MKTAIHLSVIGIALLIATPARSANLRQGKPAPAANTPSAKQPAKGPAARERADKSPSTRSRPMRDKTIINIINFVRGVEPRDPSADLVGTTKHQIELVQKHGLPGTWLLQYDALVDPRFKSLMKILDSRQEVGIWFEIVQAQVEKAGLKWRGRPGFTWDWSADVGFSAGYTPAEREKLADVVMEEFRSQYGHYPASVGSWFMDAHLIGYLHDRYGIVASCNCKDQWGTDGYTLWGGYYNQAYYPSRNNAFMPAQTAANQIPVPIFRMLGSDPLYQYDAGIHGNGQLVVTLEPVYQGGGGSPKWVRWFFDQLMNTPSLSFGYAQVGQENSFGWPAMAKGLTDQVELLQRLAAKNQLRVETLEDSGKWFRSRYPTTPASAMTTLTDWKGEGHQSIWYCSRFYRANLFWDDGHFRVRDLRRFDESYAERYLAKTCAAPPAVYDTPPVLDGLLWSDDKTTAGIRFVEILPDAATREFAGGPPSVKESAEAIHVEWRSGDGATVKLACEPETWRFSASSAKPWALEMRWAASKKPPIVSIEDKRLNYSHEGFPYQIPCLHGHFEAANDGNSVRILPDAEGKIELGLGRNPIGKKSDQ